VHDLAAMRERVRIGMDLHDGVIQELYAAGLKVEDAAHLVPHEPDQAIARMQEAQDVVRTVIGDVRTYVYGLQDGDRSVDLEPAFRHLVAEFKPGAPAVVLDLRGETRLPAVTAANVLHIVREAVANAVRHAGATRISIRSATEDGRLLISVEDDGRGFEPLTPATGLGLGDMRERAAWCHGEVSVEPIPGLGTTVRLSIPVPPLPATAGAP
jgi:signal transduction histidine kinase